MKKLFIFALIAVFSFPVFSQMIPEDSAERAKLAKQLSRNIPLQLGKVEGAMPQINLLLKNGEKIQARQMVEDALQQIAKIEADQELLAQIDETADEEDRMVAQVLEAKQYLVNKANMLRNAIGVYISCDAALFEAKYPLFIKEIQGALSELGISYVDNAAQADWCVYITAVAREYNTVKSGNTALYYTYVDAQLAIDKKKDNKRVYEGSLSRKGGHTHNFEKAAYEAYRDMVPQISAIIEEQIKK